MRHANGSAARGLRGCATSPACAFVVVAKAAHSGRTLHPGPCLEGHLLALEHCRRIRPWRQRSAHTYWPPHLPCIAQPPCRHGMNSPRHRSTPMPNLLAGWTSLIPKMVSPRLPFGSTVLKSLASTLIQYRGNGATHRRLLSATTAPGESRGNLKRWKAVCECRPLSRRPVLCLLKMFRLDRHRKSLLLVTRSSPALEDQAKMKSDVRKTPGSPMPTRVTLLLASNSILVLLPMAVSIMSARLWNPYALTSIRS